MFEQIVDELKQQFMSDIEFNLTHCPDPFGFFTDRVAQYKLGMSHLSKYASLINENNVFDILAHVKSEIIEASQPAARPLAFLEAISDICEAKEKKMSIEVFRAIEMSRIELDLLYRELDTPLLKRGCEYVAQLVDWIKGSNLHAELRSIEHSLDSFHRHTMEVIRSEQSDFLKGATMAISILKNRWFGLSPMVIKASSSEKGKNHCEWHRYTDAASLIKGCSGKLDKFQSSYILISGSRSEGRLAKELRFFRAAKEQLVRLVDSDLDSVIENIQSSRDVALGYINSSTDITSKQKQALMYFLTSATEVVSTMAGVLKPQLSVSNEAANKENAPKRRMVYSKPGTEYGILR